MLTISVSTCEPVSIESEIVRVVSPSTTEISEITRLQYDLQDPDTVIGASVRYAILNQKDDRACKQIYNIMMMNKVNGDFLDFP